jgi:rhodanese-related sulfurtransferase
MNRQQNSSDGQARQLDDLRVGGAGQSLDDALPLLRREGSLTTEPDPFSTIIHRGRQRRLSTFSAPDAVGATAGFRPTTTPTSATPRTPINEFNQFAATLGGRGEPASWAPPDPQRLIGEALRAGGAAALAALFQGGAPRPNAYDAILDEPNQTTGQISTDEILRIIAEGTSTVFDGRTRLEYALGHIPSALSTAPKPGTPMSQYVSDVAEIARIVPDKAASIIVYCNGPFCGKSRRLGEELVKAGFSNVRRYQLGSPTWRALVGPMEIETEGIRYIQKDPTAVFLDARSPDEFVPGSFPGARNVPVDQIVAAKDDGRLPMDDFNTRVVTCGRDAAQALALAVALAQNGFNNVKFYSGTPSSLQHGQTLMARRL